MSVDEFTPIPTAPAYEINRRGQVRKRDTHYRITARRRRVRLWLDSGYLTVNPRVLAAELFAVPNAYETAKPVQEPVDVASHEQADDVWRPCTDLPGLEICRSGEVRHASTGEPVRTLRSAAYAHPYVHTRVNGKSVHRAIHVLLEEAFGPGSAAAAGFPVPDMAHVHALRAALQKRAAPRGSRTCHDCGTPTDNYRCNACWKRVRGYGVGDEPAEETCNAHDVL